jgi:hypothetical protein
MTLVKGPYALTFVTGASNTSSIYLGDVYDRIQVIIPSTSGVIGANEKVYIESSDDGSTFYRHTADEATTSVIGGNDLSIKSGISNRIVNIPYQGGNYMRLVQSAAVTASAQGVYTVYGFKS